MSRKGVITSDPIFYFKATFRNVLNFCIIWFVVSLFLILIVFQFSPTLAQNNALLFYSAIDFSSPITTLGVGLLATALVLLFMALIIGYFRLRVSFIFGAISMIIFAMFFFTGTFIMFNTVTL